MVLDAHLTQYDRRYNARNPYAMGHYLAASKRVEGDVSPGQLTPEGVAMLKRSINRHFIVSDMPPARKTIKDLDAFLVTGELHYPGAKKAKKKATKKKATKKKATKKGGIMVGGVCISSKVKYWARDDQSKWHLVSQTAAARIVDTPKGDYARLKTSRGTTDVALLAAMPPEYKASDMRGQQTGGATLWDWALGAKTCTQVKTQIDNRVREDVDRQRMTGGRQHRYVGLYLKMRDDLCGGGAAPKPAKKVGKYAVWGEGAAVDMEKRFAEKSVALAAAKKFMAAHPPKTRRAIVSVVEADKYTVGHWVGRDGEWIDPLTGEKPVPKKATKKATARAKATKTMEQVRAALLRFLEGGASGARHRLTDLAALPVFRGVHFSRLEKAAEQLKEAGKITFNGVSAARKKATTAKRKTPAKKKPAKRTRSRADEARAKRLAKKNAAARRKKAAKKTTPRVQRSPAEERRILNAWKRGAGAV